MNPDLDNYNLYREEHKPLVTLTGHEYTIVPPGAHRTTVTVEVDQYGMLNITAGLWFGEWLKYKHNEPNTTLATWKLQREVFEWMQEWELAVLQPIGPEDSEWFATTNLDPGWGLPI